MGILVSYVVKLPRRGLRDSLRGGGLADRLLLRISYHMAIFQLLSETATVRSLTPEIEVRPATRAGSTAYACLRGPQ